MDPPKLDYAPAGSEPRRHLILLYFWATYALGALIGFPLVGVGAWTALSGRGPDQSGALLLVIGVGVTAFAVALAQLLGWRTIRSSSGSAAALAGFIVGMFSSLAGIAVAIVFFS